MRKVRRVAGDTLSHPVAMKRSITEGWRQIAGVSSRPTKEQNSPSFPVANKSAFARPRVAGAQALTQRLAKEAASLESACGR